MSTKDHSKSELEIKYLDYRDDLEYAIEDFEDNLKNLFHAMIRIAEKYDLISENVQHDDRLNKQFDSYIEQRFPDLMCGDLGFFISLHHNSLTHESDPAIPFTVHITTNYVNSKGQKFSEKGLEKHVLLLPGVFPSISAKSISGRWETDTVELQTSYQNYI